NIKLSCPIYFSIRLKGILNSLKIFLMLNQAIRSRIRSVAFCMQKLRSVIPPLWLLILLTNGRRSPVVYLSVRRMLTTRIEEPSLMEPKALWNHLTRNMGALVASKIHVATHGGLHPHRPDILMP